MNTLIQNQATLGQACNALKMTAPEGKQPLKMVGVISSIAPDREVIDTIAILVEYF